MSAALPFPVLALETSTHAQGLRLRRVHPHLALALWTMLPSPCQHKVGTREFGFRSLGGWPASPLPHATPETLLLPA
jgi:hypothetical protein